MKWYRGLTDTDKPHGGGSFIDAEGFGAEIYNFLPFNGKLYGFVEAGWDGGNNELSININNLGALRNDASISGILVIWVARHRIKKATVIVGWYKNATVYRKRQQSPSDARRQQPNGEGAPYFATANRENCTLIPHDKRDYVIPRGKGGLGQKNMWYASGAMGITKKNAVLDYLSNYENQLSIL